MKVDFRAIEIENIDGTLEKVDIAKTFGNAMFAQGRTFEVVELARAIWKDGEVELDKEQAEIIKEHAPLIFQSYVLHTAIVKAVSMK